MRTREQIVLVRSIKNPSITRRMTATSARLNNTYWEPVEPQPIVIERGPEIEIINPHGKYNVVAIIPVNGRIELLKQTIKRFYKKNNLIKVICVGDNPEDKKVCQRAGAHFVEYKNHPLGEKWNAGFKVAKRDNPDACLFVGSSDWLSDNWASSLLPLMDKYDMVGTPGCHFLDIKEGDNFRVINWGGYIGDRSTESIGIGRLLSARVLEKLNWEPFTNGKDGSLDYDMFLRVKRAGGKITMVKHPELISLSISTDQWKNKHRFDDHIKGDLKRNSFFISDANKFLNINFPEALKIFE